MDIDFILLFLAISSYSAILPIGLSIFRWKYLSFELKILSVYLFLSLITDITTFQLAVNHVNNLYLLYVFTLIEFGLFSWVYHRIFESFYLKKAVIVIAALFFLIFVVSLYQNGVSSYATAPRTVESIVFTIYAILYFNQILKGNHSFGLEKDAMFWFNGGLLVYFAGSLLFFSLSSFILEHASLEMQRKLFTTPAILNIVQKLLFTIAIWVSQRKK